MLKASTKSAGFGFLQVADFANGAKEAPSSILLLNDGDLMWEGLEGYKLDQGQADAVVSDFKNHGTDLPIDYDHASIEVPAMKAPAAGWITDLHYVPGSGLHADVTWTAEGKKDVESGAYRYHSPVILTNNKTKKIERLHSVALTNRPRTRHQRELLAASLNNDPKESNMDLKELKGFLAEAGVELAADATDETVLSAALDLGKKALPSKKALEGLTALTASLKTKLGLADTVDEKGILAALDALQASSVPAEEYKTLKAKVDQLEGERALRAGQELISLSVEEGKLNPNNEKQMEWARGYAKKDAEGFKAWSASAQVLYPVGRVIHPNKGDGRSGIPGEGTDRASVISSARAEFKNKPEVAKFTEEVPFVNDALRMKGLQLLGKDELK